MAHPRIAADADAVLAQRIASGDEAPAGGESTAYSWTRALVRQSQRALDELNFLGPWLSRAACRRADRGPFFRRSRGYLLAPKACAGFDASSLAADYASTTTLEEQEMVHPVASECTCKQRLAPATDG